MKRSKTDADTRSVGSTVLAVLLLVAMGMAGTAEVYAATAPWKPDKSIEIIVGTGPGGGQDKTARTLNRLLVEKHLVDVAVTVVNKPGGGGAVGWTYLNQHAGEGNIIYVGNPTLLTNHIVGRSPINYTHITALAILLSESVAISVLPASPLKTGKDLLERLKKDSASVSVAVGSSLGSTNHIAMALIAKSAGGDARKLRTVVFQGGGEAITALLGGHVDVNSSAANNVVPHLEAGKLRVLGVAAARRLGGVLSSVPTWKEQGVNAVSSSWRGLMGPRGMTPEQVAYWDRVLAALVKTEDWKKDLQDNFWDEGYVDARNTRKRLDEEYAEYKAILTELGVAR